MFGRAVRVSIWAALAREPTTTTKEAMRGPELGTPAERQSTEPIDRPRGTGPLLDRARYMNFAALRMGASSACAGHGLQASALAAHGVTVFSVDTGSPLTLAAPTGWATPRTPFERFDADG